MKNSQLLQSLSDEINKLEIANQVIRDQDARIVIAQNLAIRKCQEVEALKEQLNAQNIKMTQVLQKILPFSNNPTIWTEKEFEDAVGLPPTNDDLERCNCPDAGQIGHWHCGICEHSKPVFMCEICFFKPIEKTV